jgi:hypothetical protein
VTAAQFRPPSSSDPITTRVEFELPLRPTISARGRFYADTRPARRGNAPLRQTRSTAGPVHLSERIDTPRAVPFRRLGGSSDSASETRWSRVESAHSKPPEAGHGGTRNQSPVGPSADVRRSDSSTSAPVAREGSHSSHCEAISDRLVHRHRDQRSPWRSEQALRRCGVVAQSEATKFRRAPRASEFSLDPPRPRALLGGDRRAGAGWSCVPPAHPL